jgi:hypothetical protein
MRFLLVVPAAAAMLFASCATKPTVYQAPDASKVAATTKRLSAAIAKQAETTARVEAKAQEAQESSDRIAEHSASVLQIIRELEPFIPAEQRPKFDELKTAADAQIAEEGKLATIQAGERGEIEQLKKDNALVVKERDRLVQVDLPKYQADAKKTADAATRESAEKVEYKKQLTSQKILGWLWKLGGGAVVLVIIALVVLWWTGKLAFKFAV